MVSVGSGLTMPDIGMGTASYPPADAATVKSAVVEAIGAGYHHFDMAFIYRSEQPLGEAIAEAINIGPIKSRDELFITSKLCTFAEQDLLIPAIKTSLENLRLEYLDLYLIHWPLKFIKDPSAMEECQLLSLTKAIGVSNFSTKKLDEILSFAKIPPAVNQVSIRNPCYSSPAHGHKNATKRRRIYNNVIGLIKVEMNPLRQQKVMKEFCKAKGIHVSAHFPLGS
ncbi:beta-carotene hydroxylase [Hibiscus syriacus]|uniref:Beta-carotene hydroxylase n=1 Tax=Hibiscus syriacus TaxID=106335 RepID=A0A6A3BNJ8_HIBSY|nr:beta-carotene hydroxylase [Hibiscus syriacus]